MNCITSERQIGFDQFPSNNGESRRQCSSVTIPLQAPNVTEPLDAPELPTQPQIAAIVRYMMQNLTKPISVSTLSAMIDLSPSALFRSFKRATGHSPIAFLIRARMKLAIKLLEETDLQIKQIAVLVGYPDEFHFSRRFKSTIGVAPHYYRGGRLAKERSDLQNSC